MHSSRYRGKFDDVRAVRFERFNGQFRACQAAKFPRCLGVWLGWVPNLIDGLDVEGRIMHGAKQDVPRLQRAEAGGICRARLTL